MERFRSLPGLRPVAVFMVALSLSIGWGIRGNFGHESGAMIAGVLASVAACLMSGRADWRRRVAFFALFGGLGFGFGGSISYMYPISFAGSEQWGTCIYGFFATFFVGLLWAGLGGMGAALPAVMERRRLNEFCMPVAFALAAMAASNLVIHPWLAETLVIPGADLMDATWHRHHNPLYWFDADWFSAAAAVAGVCLYDLWDRRFAGVWRLVLLGGVGAAAGVLVYYLTGMVGLNDGVASLLVIPLGDATAINPATGEPFGDVTFLSNWPNFVHYYPQHLGWLLGLTLGVAIYFFRYGAWRHDSKLILYLAVGWLLAFLLLPTLGSIPLQSIGGFRLTPPRSDDWAGITGVFVAAMIYCLRHRLGGVAFAGAVTGLTGGFLFIFTPFLRALLRLPGHPLRVSGASAFWTHYQSANWHSIMEQWHGFGHGIGLAIALGLLAGMVNAHDDTDKRSRGAEMFAVLFVLLFITLMNVFKNVDDWTQAAVPATMKAPLFATFEWSAGVWFLITWAALSTVLIALMVVHLRRPLPIVPASWRGRGQILYLAFLWIMVIANFERALVNFHESRLVTEWVIIMNAGLATFLILAMPRPAEHVQAVEPASYGALLWRIWLYATPVIACALIVMAVFVRMLYGSVPLEHPTVNHKRWGEEAQWRIKPILKHSKHL